MVHFFSDLDNTLIYSHRHALPGARLAAEWLDGREQSYMTKKSFDFLAENVGHGLELIPVTTRTEAQYERLGDTLGRLGVRSALVCNGGVLLEDGQVREDWLWDTFALAERELRELPAAVEWLRERVPDRELHTARELMVYVRAEDPPAAAAELKYAVGGLPLNVYFDSRKVYCLPASVNKGAALKRWMEYKRISRAAAAGDSVPDIPMLEEADLAFMPEALAGLVRNPRKRAAGGNGCFADFICEELKKEIEMYG